MGESPGHLCGRSDFVYLSHGLLVYDHLLGSPQPAGRDQLPRALHLQRRRRDPRGDTDHSAAEVRHLLPRPHAERARRAHSGDRRQPLRLGRQLHPHLRHGHLGECQPDGEQHRLLVCRCRRRHSGSSQLHRAVYLQRQRHSQRGDKHNSHQCLPGRDNPSGRRRLHRRHFREPHSRPQSVGQQQRLGGRLPSVSGDPESLGGY